MAEQALMVLILLVASSSSLAAVEVAAAATTSPTTTLLTICEAGTCGRQTARLRAAVGCDTRDANRRGNLHTRANSPPSVARAPPSVPPPLAATTTIPNRPDSALVRGTHNGSWRQPVRSQTCCNSCTRSTRSHYCNESNHTDSVAAP